MDLDQCRTRRAEGEAAIIDLKKHRTLVLVVAAALSGGAAAQDEHSRQLAAGLAVMAGDVRQLAGKGMTPQRREGLRARLAGDLSGLPLLLRRTGGTATLVPPLRTALLKEDWSLLVKELAALRRRYPLDVRTVLPTSPTPERLRLGEAIHRQACTGCHDAPSTDTKLPALNLFKQIRSMHGEEFAARLIIGVRGNRSTAYRNPFSDLELSALISYYGSVKTLPY